MGSLVLTDNVNLKGQIQFNDKLGIVKFKTNQGEAEQSFSEHRILEMQFYDEDAGRWRNFASFNVREDLTGWQGNMLFEILMEFEDFALLARIERVNIALRASDNYGGVAKVGYEQYEKFLLVDIEGSIEVVLAVNEFERDKFTLAGKNGPYLNKQALERYLAHDWDKFRRMVKQNELNLRKREDFLRAFEYYQAANKEGGKGEHGG